MSAQTWHRTDTDTATTYTRDDYRVQRSGDDWLGQWDVYCGEVLLTVTNGVPAGKRFADWHAEHCTDELELAWVGVTMDGAS